MSIASRRGTPLRIVASMLSTSGSGPRCMEYPSLLPVRRGRRGRSPPCAGCPTRVRLSRASVFLSVYGLPWKDDGPISQSRSMDGPAGWSYPTLHSHQHMGHIHRLRDLRPSAHAPPPGSRSYTESPSEPPRRSSSRTPSPRSPDPSHTAALGAREDSVYGAVGHIPAQGSDPFQRGGFDLRLSRRTHPSGPASKFTIRRTNRSLLAGALSAMRRVSAVSAGGFRSWCSSSWRR